MPRALDRTVEAFTLQIDWCARMDSRLYAEALTAAKEDLERGGPVLDVVRDFDKEPVSAALALRLMGGIHRLVLMGLAPGLAAHYPSVGGRPDYDVLGQAVIDTISAHIGYLRDALHIAPQTNEIGRSVFLLPGLLHGIGEGSGDVRLLEIGSSGGLNLLLDRFRYEVGAWSWGSVGSPAVIRSEWRGAAPSELGGVEIVSRRGCDPHPLDPNGEESQLRLLSFLWPDQVDRIERTRGAFAIAADVMPTVDRSHADSWLADQLDSRPDRGTTTVLQHSVMWQYLEEHARDALTTLIAEAGAAATRSRPFVHVSFEPPPQGMAPDGQGMMLTVTRWPGGVSHVLARGHPHGTWVQWQ